MKHLGTIKLETEQLILRKLVISDARSLYINWASDPDVVKFMRLNLPKNIKETENIINSFIEKYNNLETYRWGIELKEISEVIGFIGLSIISEYDMTADFAYTIGKKFWNKGYATEALRAVLDFGLNKVGFNRLEAYHSINNMSSGKVMKKAGMKYEGRARQKYKSHIGFEDCDIYAIIKDDLE